MKDFLIEFLIGIAVLIVFVGLCMILSVVLSPLSAIFFV